MLMELIQVLPFLVFDCHLDHMHTTDCFFFTGTRQGYQLWMIMSHVDLNIYCCKTAEIFSFLYCRLEQ